MQLFFKVYFPFFQKQNAFMIFHLKLSFILQKKINL